MKKDPAPDRDDATEVPGITILNDDFITTGSIPCGSIDLIVTSPPYNIGVGYDQYEDSLPFEKYLDWMEEVACQCRRVLRYDGSFFFNISDKVSDELRALRVALRVHRMVPNQPTNPTTELPPPRQAKPPRPIRTSLHPSRPTAGMKPTA